MVKPKRLSRRAIYKNPWMNLYVDKVRMPGGKIIEKHHVVEAERPSVAVLVENNRNEILFVHVYRYVTGKIEWELPAGNADRGESVIRAGQREAYEETGYETKRPRHLYTFHPMNGSTNKVFHIVKCRTGRRTGTFDPNEIQRVKWFTRDHIKRMVRRGVIHDGFTLTALLFLFNPDLRRKTHDRRT